MGTIKSRHLQLAAGLLTEAALLKTTLSIRMLSRSAGDVAFALDVGDLDGARRALRSLVSRDTAELPAPLLAAAAIESLAENASDAFVAPALFYMLGGLTGAAVYRGINTLDAMLGYRGAYEWRGRIAARLDDVANLVPARLTAGLVVLAAHVRAGRGWAAWRTLCQDARLTKSPNAGYPMSAMAGALGVELEKAGHYRLGVPGRQPETSDISSARHLVSAVVFLVLLLAALAERVRCAPAT